MRNSYFRKNRLDKQRKRKLLSKAQKAGVLNKLPEIVQVYGWNKRFRLINTLSHNDWVSAN